MFGGRVKYGFKGVYAYAMEITGVALDRTQFLIVLLAPIMIISIIALLIPGRTGEIVFLLNSLGSVGDLLMDFYLIRVSDDDYIVDRDYGFEVIKKPNVAGRTII